MNPPYWFFGARLRILADGPQTESRYDLIEGDFPAGTETPLHLHTQYDELIYVREGEFTVYTDAGTVVLAPGQSVFVPRNTSHAVEASGRAGNRALTIASPAGFAALIRAVGIPDATEGIPPGQPNDLGLFIELAAKSGDVIEGAPGARPVVKKKP
ncbi:MAG TPA: cupin domain-containing protein [Cytophagales bacterium]|jgi:quercetin dioxygenase-like cupin family protein